MTLAALNAMDAPAAAEALLSCCGSHRWADEVSGARPFATIDGLVTTSDAVWSALEPVDWLEAFSAHPRIGDRHAAGWAADEQAGAAGARAAVTTRLAARNREYERRFGHIFIVCAMGRTAEEMVEDLERRLTHEPDLELRVAAEEQRKITQLRIRKLLSQELG